MSKLAQGTQGTQGTQRVQDALGAHMTIRRLKGLTYGAWRVNG